MGFSVDLPAGPTSRDDEGAASGNVDPTFDTEGGEDAFDAVMPKEEIGALRFLQVRNPH